MATDWSKWIYTQTATPHMDAYKRLEQGYRAQAEKDIANMNERQTNDLNKSNAQYDNTAKQNYINYMQAQKKLPSQLNALGIRGGASESSAIRLNTNYGSNVASNEAARNSAAENIRQTYAQQIADYNSNLENTLRQAYETAYHNQVEYENNQKQRDLEQFSNVIEGLYTSKKGYKNLIAQLRKSNDPNKEMKIMLATRAMNMLKGSGGGGGGGGGGRSYGGGYGSYGGSSYGGSVDLSGVTNSIGKTAKATAKAVTSKSGSKKGGKSYTWTAPKRSNSGRNRRSISRGNGLRY